MSSIVLENVTLRYYWEKACHMLHVPNDATEQYWNIIETKYSEKHRFYHTVKHLTHMFESFVKVVDQLSRPDLVTMAIFFHDVIYEPKQTDNEEQSANLFRQFSKFFNSTDRVAPSSENAGTDNIKVCDWILATKKHETEVHRTHGMVGTEDLHYFLDMDMAILGAPSKEYEDYAAYIRQEYIHVPEKEFRERRAKILRSFLTIPNIYATEEFRSSLEDNARENIQQEIERLEGSV